MGTKILRRLVETSSAKRWETTDRELFSICMGDRDWKQRAMTWLLEQKRDPPHTKVALLQAARRNKADPAQRLELSVCVTMGTVKTRPRQPRRRITRSELARPAGTTWGIFVSKIAGEIEAHYERLDEAEYREALAWWLAEVLIKQAFPPQPVAGAIERRVRAVLRIVAKTKPKESVAFKRRNGVTRRDLWVRVSVTRILRSALSLTPAQVNMATNFLHQRETREREKEWRMASRITLDMLREAGLPIPEREPKRGPKTHKSA